MATNTFSDRINDLFRRGEWQQARRLLEKERAKDPQNHWLLTQLGVTFYEQKKYKKALKLLLASRDIVPDCPLTLWNLGGTLDALGKHIEAVSIYKRLLGDTTSAQEDPCWESKEWAAALKADCVYSLGVGLEHLGKKQKAEQCYREYLNLLLIGIQGTYSVEDVTKQIRRVHGNGKARMEKLLRKAVSATLQTSGGQSPKRRGA